MKATLKFPLRIQAEKFAKNYARYSKKGHLVGSGLVNVEVTVFDVTDQDKDWIDGYISGLNEILSK